MTSSTDHHAAAADLLHAAAAKLRGNADGATPGQRDIEIRGIAVHVATFDGRDTAYTGTTDETPAVPNAAHYASWPPEAAVALADWIDAAAERGNPEETASAVALARILLDGTPMLDDYDAACLRLEREQIVHDDPALAAQIRKGIAEAERGETVHLGSFAQYAEDGDDG